MSKPANEAETGVCVSAIFEQSAAEAARLITDVARDESLPLKQRYEAALEVLNRLFGKAALQPKADKTTVEVVFKQEAEECAG